MAEAELVGDRTLRGRTAQAGAQGDEKNHCGRPDKPADQAGMFKAAVDREMEWVWEPWCIHRVVCCWLQGRRPQARGLYHSLVRSVWWAHGPVFLWYGFDTSPVGFNLLNSQVVVFISMVSLFISLWPMTVLWSWTLFFLQTLVCPTYGGCLFP